MIRMEMWAPDVGHVPYMDYFAENDMEVIKFYDWVERFRQTNDSKWELRLFEDKTNEPLDISDLIGYPVEEGGS